MNLLAFGAPETVIATFLATLLFQIIVFRVVRVARPVKAVALIFAVSMLITAVFCSFTWSPLRVVHFVLFFGAATFCYLMTFVNTLESGPSFMILEYLEKQKTAREDDLQAVIERKNVLGQRLGEMLKSGVIRQRENHFEITSYGQRYLFFYTFYRRLLGMKHRGG